MGFVSWWRGKAAPASADRNPVCGDAPGMNGAVEVRRPADLTVFEFGSAAASGDGVMLAGFCPISDEIEPCRWEITPASGSGAPLFRVVF